MVTSLGVLGKGAGLGLGPGLGLGRGVRSRMYDALKSCVMPIEAGVHRFHQSFEDASGVGGGCLFFKVCAHI